MRRLASLLLLAGCSFGAPNAGTTDDAPVEIDAPPVDAPLDAAIDAPAHVDAMVDAPTQPADAMIDAPTVQPDAPIDAAPTCVAWCHSKTITIQNATNGPHVRFIMLLQIDNDTQLRNAVRADGFDIRFRNPLTNTLVPYERVSYANGSLLAWVQVPSLTNGATLVMEYGAGAAPDQSTNPWSASWVGVYRLDETTGDVITDRAGTPHNGALHRGTMNDSEPHVAGIIGNALAFNAADKSLTFPQSTQLDATGASGTIELWARPAGNTTGSYQTIVVTGNRFGGTGNGYEFGRQSAGNGGNLYFYPNGAGNQGGDNNFGAIANPLPMDQWTHIAVTWHVVSGTNKSVKLYANGVLKTATHSPDTAWNTAGVPGTWMWANDAQHTQQHFIGAIDELRVSTGERSADWLASEYSNQSAPLAFRVLGAEVVQP